MYVKEEILKIPGNDLKTKLKIVMNKLVSVPWYNTCYFHCIGKFGNRKGWY